MKFRLVFIIFLIIFSILLHRVSASSQECFILLNTYDRSSLHDTINDIKENGGSLNLIFSPNVIIGNLTSSLQTTLNTRYNVARVDCTVPTEIPDENVYGRNAVLAANVWNKNLLKKVEPEKISWDRPLKIKDDTIPKISEEELYSQYIKSKFGISSEEAMARGIELPEDFYHTSDFMIGYIAYSVVYVEGPEKPWTLDDKIYALEQIDEGLLWLRFQTPYRVIFQFPYVDEAYIDVEPTDYEKSECDVWGNKTLEYLGYEPSWNGLYQYVNDIRDIALSNWVFTIFIVRGERFADNKTAFAMHGGPVEVIPYDYKPDFIKVITAHETCHIFWASDEYSYSDRVACECSDNYNYLNVFNLNCEAGCYPGYEDDCPSCIWGGGCFSNSDCKENEYCDLDDHKCKHYCIMSIGAPNICPVIRAQIGWRDCDFDGIPDPTDMYLNCDNTCFIGDYELCESDCEGYTGSNYCDGLETGTTWIEGDVRKVCGLDCNYYETCIEDINSDGKVDIKDIGIAGVGFGSYPGHPRWDPRCDINEDEKCDIWDIARIAKVFGMDCTSQLGIAPSPVFVVTIALVFLIIIFGVSKFFAKKT